MVRYTVYLSLYKRVVNYSPLIFVAGSIAKVDSTHISGVSFVDTRTVNINACEHTDDNLVVLRVL